MTSTHCVGRYIVAMTSILLVLSSCVTPPFTRTVYVPDGTPVRLRADIPDAPIWAKVKGVQKKTTMTLPEGWYVVAPPKEKK
jgi:hypothetical protein